MRVNEMPRVLLRTIPLPAGRAVESSAPVVFWMTPPEQPVVSAFVHVPPTPVTVSAAFEPVLLSVMPPLAPLEATRWKLSGVPPTSVSLTFSAFPAPVSIVLPVPVRLSVPLVVAWTPAPLVVSMSRLPPESVSVWPSLVPMTIAWSSPVLNVLVALLTTVEPPLLPVTAMPPFSWVASVSPVSVIGPLNVTVPPGCGR